MHIYDFITDEFQYQLKQQARKGCNRFEQVLKAYRTLFLEQLKGCKPTAATTFLPASLHHSKDVKEWLQLLHHAIENEVVPAREIFDEVINGYFLFLRGKHFLSTLKYHDLLETYHLLDEEDIRSLSLFFRGTDMKGPGNKKFYHIPYNSRHQVKNQRFSFSGIPFLYLGASVADVYFELYQTNLNAHQPFMASFACSPIAVARLQSRNTRIYNITNLLFNYVNERVASLVNPLRQSTPVQPETYAQTLSVYFRKLILSHLCTFPRLNDGSPFCEEYVIPQLFTEALRMHKYDGIIFSSTTFSEQKVEYTMDFPNLRFKDNMVWFTTYTDDALYDEGLLSNFEITVKDLRGFGAMDCQTLIDKIEKQIQNASRQLQDNLEFTSYAHLKKVMTDIEQRMQLYQGMKINNQYYLHTHAGKLELIYTYQYLEFLGRQIY